jgi:hypothetical protein
MSQTSAINVTDKGLLACAGGLSVRVDFLTPCIVRVRKYLGDQPPVSPLVRYGFFRDDWPAVEFCVDDGSQAVTLTTSAFSVSITRHTLALVFCDSSGTELLAEHDPVSPLSPTVSFPLRFRLPPGRRFFGLGDQTSPATSRFLLSSQPTALGSC